MVKQRDPWTRVDYQALADAIAVAERYGERRTFKSPEDALAFSRELGVPITVDELLSIIDGRFPPTVAMIERGLHRGLFRLDKNREEGWVWVGRGAPLIPLPEYPLGAAFDVAVSYSGRSWKSHAKGLIRDLERRGLRVFRIEHSDDEELRERMRNDPLWRIRYREGIAHSRYYLPVCTRSYLDAQGSREEMFELARLTVQLRKSTHVYPMLPWFPSDEVPKEVIEDWIRHGPDQGGDDLAVYDPRGFSWIRHLFMFPQTWGDAERATFISSLSVGAEDLEAGGTISDAAALHLLTEKVVSAGEVKGTEFFRFSLRHDWWTGRAHAFRLHLSSGQCQYMGVEELVPQEGAREAWTRAISRYGTGASAAASGVDATKEEGNRLSWDSGALHWTGAAGLATAGLLGLVLYRRTLLDGGGDGG